MTGLHSVGRRRGRVVRQGPAKPRTAVRIRSAPLTKSLLSGSFVVIVESEESPARTVVVRSPDGVRPSRACDARPCTRRPRITPFAGGLLRQGGVAVRRRGPQANHRPT
jgi:hypothetical protein